MNAISVAIKLFRSRAALARRVGVTGEAVRKWERKGVPVGRVLAIEAATDHRVSRHELHPDLYPKEPWCRCPACELEQAQKRVPNPDRQDGATPPDQEEAA